LFGRERKVEKVEGADVPPPGVGVKTVIELLPNGTMSLAGMVAVRNVELTKTVWRGAPFH
jgi:hypothetical protein